MGADIGCGVGASCVGGGTGCGVGASCVGGATGCGAGTKLMAVPGAAGAAGAAGCDGVGAAVGCVTGTCASAVPAAERLIPTTHSARLVNDTGPIVHSILQGSRPAADRNRRPARARRGELQPGLRTNSATAAKRGSRRVGSSTHERT